MSGSISSVYLTRGCLSGTKSGTEIAKVQNPAFLNTKKSISIFLEMKGSIL